VKSSKNLIVVLIIAIAVFAGIYLVQQTTFFSPKATTSFTNYEVKTEIPVIETRAALDSQIYDLNQIDLNQIDQAIQENETDIPSLE
jgi:hypothetical protein